MFIQTNGRQFFPSTYICNFFQTPEEWNNCFHLAAGISVLGAVIFLLYGSSEAQPWSSMAVVEEECQLADRNERI